MYVCINICMYAYMYMYVCIYVRTHETSIFLQSDRFAKCRFETGDEASNPDRCLAISQYVSLIGRCKCSAHRTVQLELAALTGA